MCLITIVIPVYNKEQDVLRCLESISKQTYTDFKIICVDDGSTDRSSDVINEYADSSPMNIKLIQHDKNKSLLQARITGIKNTDTKYVAHIDADDLVKDDYLKNLVAGLDDQHRLVFSGTIFRNIEKEFTYDNSHIKSSLNVNEIVPLFSDDYSFSWSQWGKLWLKETYDLFVDKIPSSLYINMSEDLLLTMLYLNNYTDKVRFIYTYSYIYDMDSSSSITNNLNQHAPLEGLIQIYNVLLSELEQYLLQQMKDSKILKKESRMIFSLQYPFLDKENKTKCIDIYEKLFDYVPNKREIAIQIAKIKLKNTLKASPRLFSFCRSIYRFLKRQKKLFNRIFNVHIIKKKLITRLKASSRLYLLCRGCYRLIQYNRNIMFKNPSNLVWENKEMIVFSLSKIEELQKDYIKLKKQLTTKENDVIDLNNPKISIVVPLYNMELYVQKCLESIKLQSYNNFEVIIVNDASTDNSLQIVNTIIENDSRFKVVNLTTNQGLFNARKEGIFQAKGEYILNIDSDDWIDLQMLEKMYDEAILSNADMVECRFFKIDTDKNVWFDDYQRHGMNKTVKHINDHNLVRMLFSDRPGLFIWNKLIKKSIFNETVTKQLKEIQEHIVIHEDYLFSSIIFPHVKNASYIPNRLYYYNQRDDSSINSTTYESLCKSIEDSYNVLKYSKKSLITNNVYENYMKESRELEEVSAEYWMGLFNINKSKFSKNQQKDFKELYKQLFLP